MIENQDKYIAVMSNWSDKKFSKHLDVVKRVNWLGMESEKRYCP
jgi:hypothetical protein